jgi:hypothetical protein
MFLDFHRASKGALVISADVEGSCGESTHTRRLAGGTRG